MNLFRSVGILGSLVLAVLTGCSNAAREASNIENSAPSISSLVIGNSLSDPADAGDVLTASYRFHDLDGDSEGDAAYQWQRNGETIGGKIGNSYTLTLGDAGKIITVAVTPFARVGASPGLPVESNAIKVAPPNAVLTVSAGLKQLRFSWVPVRGASFYRVSYNPDGASGFVPVSTTSSNLTATTYDWDISVHRINWPKAQFLLEACDASTCVQSASISALDVMVGAIGYFKASNTEHRDDFGYSVALSGDGNTLAVGAYGENSAATGVNDTTTGQANNAAASAGAVYVFTRSGGTWSQQAYVKASNTGAGDYFGISVALSGDGNTLAVGAFYEDSAMTGVIPRAPAETATPDDALGTNSGAVYVFTRSGGASWSQQAYVKASNTSASDFFGSSVALSGDGNTLTVGAYLEGSAKTGVTPGAPDEAATGNSALRSGAVYVYARSGTTWSQQAYVKASNTSAGDNFGFSITLSDDGNTLAVGASVEGSAKTGVTPGAPDEAATGNSASGFGAVYVYARSGATWSQQAYVKASNSGASDFFGRSVALSGDGNTLAVGTPYEGSAKTGVTPGAPDEVATPNDSLGFQSGAVYVYARSGGAWSQQAYVKASNTGAGDFFGISVALSTNGNTLAVGAYFEDSAKTGVISGAPDTAAMPDDSLGFQSGAVYVYARSSATWSQQAYVKASNTGAVDYFGCAVALSDDSNTLAVGAYLEGSNSTGVNSAPNESGTFFSGAVYLY